MNDTSPEIQQTIRELMMKRSGVQRLRMASDMFEAARTLAIASFSPDVAGVELRLKLCERFYPEDVDADAFLRALRRSRLLAQLALD